MGAFGRQTQKWPWRACLKIDFHRPDCWSCQIIYYALRLLYGRSLQAQPISAHSRKKAHKPLRTLWVGHVTIEYTKLSFFRAPMLWFINLNVATCHIQYTSLSLCHFCLYEKTDKTRKYAIFVWHENGRRSQRAQSISSERASVHILFIILIRFS